MARSALGRLRRRERGGYGRLLERLPFGSMRDGIVQSDEEATSATLTAPARLLAALPQRGHGDGFVQEGEACDDGNAVNNDVDERPRCLAAVITSPGKPAIPVKALRTLAPGRRHYSAVRRWRRSR